MLNWNIPRLKFKKFIPAAKVPYNVRPTLDGDAGYDLYAAETIIMQPGDRRKITTGLGILIPAGFYGRITGRSGLTDIGLDVKAGTVDPSYRGEVKVQLTNASDKAFLVEAGMRIAQIIFSPFAAVQEWEEVEEFPTTTSRGENGFGHTGLMDEQEGAA